MKGRVPGISFQEIEVLFGHALDGHRKFMKTVPEAACCPVHLQIPQAFTVLFIEGLFNKKIEPSCVRVRLHLPIPNLPVPLGDPLPDLDKLRSRKLLYRCLDFLDSHLFPLFHKECDIFKSDGPAELRH